MGVARAPEEPDSLAAEAIPGRSAGAGGVQPWGTVCSSFCFQVRNDNGFPKHLNPSLLTSGCAPTGATENGCKNDPFNRGATKTRTKFNQVKREQLHSDLLNML